MLMRARIDACSPALIIKGEILTTGYEGMRTTHGLKSLSKSLTEPLFIIQYQPSFGRIDGVGHRDLWP
jgi:hypothetical protein